MQWEAFPAQGPSVCACVLPADTQEAHMVMCPLDAGAHAQLWV